MIDETLLGIIEGKDTEDCDWILNKEDISSINSYITHLTLNLEATTIISLACVLTQFIIIILITIFRLTV